ncbi:MFS transporter [Nonomuraea sp. NPDC050310]|uniref:MFS transporter n=1 Tax=Nonomuraea sp. NPDC050310 TaxID=3154935 RepID=UPI0034107658
MPRLSGLLALFTAAFAAVLTKLLPAGLLPELSGALGVPQARAGLLVTGYALASAVAAIPLTAALRGLPRRTVLMAAITAFAAFNAVSAVSSGFVLTLGSRVLAGVADGVMWSMLAGYAARMVPEEWRGRAIALVLAGITVAMSVGLPLGAALASAVGWRAAFAALSVVAVLLLLWVRRSVPPFPGEPAARRMPVRRVAALPGVRVVLATTLVVLLGHQAVYTYLAPLSARGGLPHAGVALLVFGAATPVGIWLAGLVSDRPGLGGPRAVLLGCLAGLGLAMAVLGLLGGGALALLAAVAVWGCAFGGAPTALQTSLVASSGPGGAEVATAMQATVYNLGIALGSLLGGLVLAGPGAAALPWAALPLFVLALALVGAGRTERVEDAGPAQGFTDASPGAGRG